MLNQSYNLGDGVFVHFLKTEITKVLLMTIESL